MRTSTSPSTTARRSPSPPANDWTGRPGAVARIFPAEHMIRLVCRAVPETQRRGLTALDVGCGSGRNSIGLACLGFARVIAVDPLESMLREVEQHASDAGLSIETRCAGAELQSIANTGRACRVSVGAVLIGRSLR